MEMAIVNTYLLAAIFIFCVSGVGYTSWKIGKRNGAESAIDLMIACDLVYECSTCGSLNPAAQSCEVCSASR